MRRLERAEADALLAGANLCVEAAAWPHTNAAVAGGGAAGGIASAEAERQCSCDMGGRAMRETVERHTGGEVSAARVSFIARAVAEAATFPRGIAQKSGRGKSFNARSVFVRPLEVHAGSRAHQTSGLFSAHVFCRVCWRCS
jgi:hypothetical protein